MQDYQHFLGEQLAAIPLVAQTHTYAVIEEVKSETAISLAKP
jgi:Lrp/AsnC family leucine-responsive transcriptional regulator